MPQSCSYWAIINYKQALPLLKATVDIRPNTQLLLQLGYNQQQIKDYDGAEANYTKAISIQPKAFMPKYMLFDLYRTLKDQEKAKATVAEIAVFSIKIPSEEVRSIKKEAINYLNSNPHDGT